MFQRCSYAQTGRQLRRRAYATRGEIGHRPLLAVYLEGMVIESPCQNTAAFKLSPIEGYVTAARRGDGCRVGGKGKKFSARRSTTAGQPDLTAQTA